MPTPRSDDAIKIGLAIGGFILFSRIGRANASIYPPGTIPSGGTLPGGASLPLIWSREQIMIVQSALNELYGFGLAVDGVIGLQTQNAIGNYQVDKGFADTGTLDAITYAALLADTSYQ